MIPHNGGTRHFTVTALTGLDWWIVNLIPHRWARPLMARRLIGIMGEPTGKAGDLTFSIPGWPTYEIVDSAGRCVPFHRE